jgi:hypothetical protein
MNWLKFFQRLLAIAAIFLIWMVVYRLTMNAEKIRGLESVEIPKQTLGIIQVNTPQLSKALLFEFAFNNRDPRILKIVSEYWQNLAQDSSSNQLPIDFQEGITLLKVKQGREIVWMISGKHIQVDHSLEPELGFVKNHRYYWILNSSLESCSKLKGQLIRSGWYTFSSDQSNPIQYHLISQGKVTNSYQFKINDEQMTVLFKPYVKVVSVTPRKDQKQFHVTSSLNQGSFIPKRYLNYKKIIESLSGFSVNYFGAKYIDDDSGLLYIEPQFDMFLTFSKPTAPADIFPLLKELMGDGLRYTEQRLFLHGSKYYFSSRNDSTVFIGKNKMNPQINTNTFTMNGNPEVITEISNLGWKAGVLELIPEYRALKEFSHSIKSITTRNSDGGHAISIQFKPGVNAQLESFLLVLTLVNAYQF